MRSVPGNELLRRRWIQRLAYDEDEEQRISYVCANSDRSFVCEEHFDDEAFTSSDRAILRHTALPRDYVSSHYFSEKFISLYKQPFVAQR